MNTVCGLLSEDMQIPVTPFLANAPSRLAEAIGGGEADFAWISPTLLLMASALANVVPLLSSVREGRATFHTVLFTREASAIQNLGDIHDARAAWVAPTSASGYLVARLTMTRRGVDLDEAITDELFLDAHGAVGQAVLAGEADVGATYAHFKDGKAKPEHLLSSGYLDGHPDARARILAIGGPIPSDMMVAHPRVPLSRRITFAGALSRLANCPIGGMHVRRTIGADSFQAVSHEALSELDSLMRASHAL